MLNVEHLSVNYGYITALTDISFHVEEGEIITLIGSNGAGQTTTGPGPQGKRQDYV